MATAYITFGKSESPSVEELSGGMPVQVNAVVDATGAIRVRPGISAWSGFPATTPTPVGAASTYTAPVIGMVSWNGYLIYVTGDTSNPGRNIYVVSAGVATSLSYILSSSFLGGALRPVFAATRPRVLISGGGIILKWEGTIPEAFSLANLATGLGLSVAVSHIATISQRIVANAADPSGLIYWSDIGDTGAGNWQTGLNFLEAETKQDPVIGLYENTNELVALGTETVQMFAPDPSVTFSTSRTMEFGWGPAHSYVPLDEKFMGLDSRRRIMVSNGRSFEPVSAPMIGRQLEDMTTVADCWGARYKWQNYDMALWNFPTDGRFFAFETLSQNWSEWKTKDTSRGGLKGLDITACYFNAATNETLVGLSTGRIAKFDPTATTDLGNPITLVITSSFEDHGESRSKKCNAVFVKFRRGILSDQTSAKVELSYRDDTGEYQEPYRIDVSDASDTDPVFRIRTLGTYRTRQWRITSDSVALSFVSLQEDYTVLDT